MSECGCHTTEGANAMKRMATIELEKEIKAHYETGKQVAALQSKVEMFKELLAITGAVKFQDGEWRLPFYKADGTSELINSQEWIAKRKQWAAERDAFKAELDRIKDGKRKPLRCLKHPNDLCQLCEICETCFNLLTEQGNDGRTQFCLLCEGHAKEAKRYRDALETIAVEAEHPYGQQSSAWEQLIAIGKLAEKALSASKDAVEKPALYSGQCDHHIRFSDPCKECKR